MLSALRHWRRNVLISVDQLGNSLLGGWSDETLSSRAWRWHLCGCSWPRRIIDCVFRDSRHCYESWLSEKRRLQLPPDLR